MVAPTLVGHHLGGTTSSHHGRWSDVQGRGSVCDGFVPHLKNKVELCVPNDGMKCFGYFVDKAFLNNNGFSGVNVPILKASILPESG